MRINKLTLENFKQYKKTEINFPDGLTGLTGKNGAGKSTIFEAIYLALFGKYLVEKSQIRNDFATKNEPVLIELDFEDNGNNYIVKRIFKGNDLIPGAQLFSEGKSEPDVSGTTDVNKRITRILKIDHDNFKKSFFSEQKEVNALLDLNKKDRQTQLRKMLGLSKLDKLEDNVIDENKTKKVNLKANENLIKKPEEINLLNQNLTELQEKQIEISDEKTKIFELYNITVEKQKLIHENLNKLNKIKNNYNSLMQSKVQIEEQIKADDDNVYKYNEKLKELLRLKDELTLLKPQKDKYEETSKIHSKLIEQKNIFVQRTGVLKAIEVLKSDYTNRLKESENLESELKSYPDILSQITNTERLIEEKEKHLKDLEKSKADISGLLKVIEKDGKSTKAKLEKITHIGINTACPECQRPLDDETYNTLVNTYSVEIKEKRTEYHNQDLILTEYKTKIDMVDREIKITRDELSKLLLKENDRQNEINNLKKLQNQIIVIKKNIEEKMTELDKYAVESFNEELFAEITKLKDELFPIVKKHDQTEKLVEQIPEFENNIKTTSDNRVKHLEENEEVNTKIATLNYDERELQKTQTENVTIAEELKKISQKKNEIDVENGKISNEISIIHKDLDENNKKVKTVETLRTEILIFEKLINFLKEYKAKLTSRELPTISQIANDLFSEITGGRYVGLNITTDFELKVIRDGKVVDINTLSGGEKDLASICLRIAISKRIAALAGRINMGFLALDEVFGSQDQTRREILVNALNTISKDFKQIFVITHNQDVEEVFPARLFIQKNKNYSEAELIMT